ncbi:unnamed protein product [Nippostrongylus brasiliensis]|uniref:EB domain-containing protein n=1 Tax=Nippostrongylus brasiliensis TaxID=27835 RepID=A0A0N4XCY0_NIPBR|nr:unnamed protein product [Nippostrongylus brasiliensis]
MAFCDTEKMQCVSRMIITANCSEFTTIDPCYASQCVDGICSGVPEPTKSIPKTTRMMRKKLSARAVTVRKPVAPLAVVVRPIVDAVQLLLNDTMINFDEDNTTLVDLVPSETQLLQAEMALLAARDFYNVSDIIGHGNLSVIPKPTDVTSTKVAPPITTSTSTTTTTTTATSTTAARSDQPHFDRSLNSWVYSFDSNLPYPSVYFPITVIAGSYRPRARPQRNVKGVTVVSSGANLPSGYTHVVEVGFFFGKTMNSCDCTDWHIRYSAHWCISLYGYIK